jgi:hypothetical protein
MGEIKHNIESMYKEFLDRMKLSEKTMHPMQKIQVKQAFMGGLSSFMKIIIDFDAHTEQECKNFLTRAEEDLRIYWKNEVIHHLPKN